MQASTVAGLAIAGGALGALWLARRSKARVASTGVTRPSVESVRAPEGPALGAAPAPPHTVAPPAPRGLTREFDELFRLHGQGIPVPYLRALGNAESGLRPSDRLGLINVVPVAVADYNRRRAASVRPEQMRDPAVNVRVAADTLRAIIDSYRRNHPDVAELAEDWTREAFVGLLTFGWNAGYSETGGVGRVVRFLRRTQPGEPITLDAVADAAHAAGAVAHLSNPRKRSYCKGVVASFRREVARDAAELRLFA